MKIPLDDDIWSRLYGPYGIENVQSILKTLHISWDDSLAKDLFWEKLHHQDTLYPVTYASLPWLWEMTCSSSRRDGKALTFFSHVCACAVANYGDLKPAERFRGLSTRTSDHHYGWINERHWMREADMMTLKFLENWFSRTAVQIAQTSLEAIGDQDRLTTAVLASGFANLNGGPNAGRALIMWADGHATDWIVEELGRPTDTDLRVSQLIAGSVEKANAAMAEFLRNWGDQ